MLRYTLSALLSSRYDKKKFFSAEISESFHFSARIHRVEYANIDIHSPVAGKNPVVI
jgi:hypothetical protein